MLPKSLYGEAWQVLSEPAVRTRLADLLRAGRAEVLKEDAGRYLDRLLETNSARTANDFADQALESRRRMEADLKRQLGAVASAAERALRVADERRAAGGEAVWARLARLDELARAVDAVDSKLPADGLKPSRRGLAPRGRPHRLQVIGACALNAKAKNAATPRQTNATSGYSVHLFGCQRQCRHMRFQAGCRPSDFTLGGPRTVSTRQSAVRTIFSATLP